MSLPKSVVVIQTAFPGDVILTLPLMQALRALLPGARLAFVAIPSAAEVLAHHPAVDEVIVYDKRGSQRGLAGIFSLASKLRRSGFEAALVPHRSLRSALLPWLAGIPLRISFDASAGRFLQTVTVRYRKDLHETERNLSLLAPLTEPVPASELPELFPSDQDRERVDLLLREQNEAFRGLPTGGMVAIAPGSVWPTKRWPAGCYADLSAALIQAGYGVVLIGGAGDTGLCAEIGAKVNSGMLVDASGRLTLLQSAEFIRRCAALVSNDSAPMHLAVAVKTPVVAIFGPTVPEFGFAPLGEYDRVVQTAGLTCRPCSIHGGESCPIKTFDCMKRISAPDVMNVLHEVLARAKANA